MLKTRINNGHFTERGLARILGISQPQLHNVIKGKRRLQTELADLILENFGLSVSDLITALELYRYAGNDSNLNLFGPDPFSVQLPIVPVTGRRGGRKGPSLEKYRPPVADKQVS